MLTWTQGLKVNATKPNAPTDDTITITSKQALLFNAVGVGNHTYMTISLRGFQSINEVVRYTHTADYTTAGCTAVNIVVTRDVGGTGRKSFPVHTCIDNKLNITMLTELVHQIMGE